MWRIPLLVLTVGLGTVGFFQVYRLNIEPSVPVGLWRLHRLPAQMEVGMVIVFSRSERRLPLLKPVVGLTGDVACVDSEGLWVRGAWYGPVVETAGGQPVPHLEGCVMVGEGEVFVASREPRSFDSRYYGPVPTPTVQARATPVWVRR